MQAFLAMALFGGAMIGLALASRRDLLPRRTDREGMFDGLYAAWVLGAGVILLGVGALSSDVGAPDGVAGALNEAAELRKCGLLVMGAYGRARLAERVFGGVTRASHAAHFDWSVVAAWAIPASGAEKSAAEEMTKWRLVNIAQVLVCVFGQ